VHTHAVLELDAVEFSRVVGFVCLWSNPDTDVGGYQFVLNSTPSDLICIDYVAVSPVAKAVVTAPPEQRTGTRDSRRYETTDWTDFGRW
jgi:hypothetical protein